MKFLSLLGKRLKDDEVIDVLEGFDMQVIYEFDRSYEGQPDEYSAASEQEGFAFLFDESQTLRIIFLYLAELHNFTPIAPENAMYHYSMIWPQCSPTAKRSS